MSNSFDGQTACRSHRWVGLHTRPRCGFPTPAPDLLAWLAVRSVSGVAMEATGGIERTVAYALADRGYQPCIVNPTRVRDFSKAISPVKNGHRAQRCGERLKQAIIVPAMI